MSNDQKHLEWIYDRLIHVYSESPNVDYMLRFRGIIDGSGAALAAEPVGEGLPTDIRATALLHPAYEPGDGSADGAQMVGLVWWHPVMGCDSLQIVVDNARNILRSRWACPAAPPAPEMGEQPVSEPYKLPEPGEVGELGELAAWLRTIKSVQAQKAATLLEQQAAPAPVVVPVAVGERPWEREGWCDEQGYCWFFSPRFNTWSWERPPVALTRGVGRFLSLPHNAIPLPQDGEGEA